MNPKSGRTVDTTHSSPTNPSFHPGPVGAMSTGALVTVSTRAAKVGMTLGPCGLIVGQEILSGPQWDLMENPRKMVV